VTSLPSMTPFPLAIPILQDPDRSRCEVTTEHRIDWRQHARAMLAMPARLCSLSELLDAVSLAAQPFTGPVEQNIYQ